MIDYSTFEATTTNLVRRIRAIELREPTRVFGQIVLDGPVSADPVIYFRRSVDMPNASLSIGHMRYGGDGSPNVAVQANTVHNVPGAWHTVVEFDDKGIVGSIHPASGQPYDRGSHFEGWMQGDSQPLFRLNSYPAAQLELGPGGAGACDVILRYMASKLGQLYDTELQCWRANAVDSTFGTGRLTEATRRFGITAAGVHGWGDGASIFDTNLYRDGVGVLRTDGSFHVIGNLTIGAKTIFDNGGDLKTFEVFEAAQIITAYFLGAAKAGAPSVTDIPGSNFMLYKNTSTGTVSLWYNDGGAMKSVALV